MARYATGKRSKAISDITGFKVNYTSLKTTYDNLRVEPDEFDVKHPQLTPAKNVVDATALFQPRPDNAEENVKLFLQFNPDIFASKIENSQKGIGVKSLGSVALLSGINFNFGADSGVAVGTGAVGSVNINTQIAETDAVGTGAIGTAVITLKITETGISGTGAIGTEAITVSITEAGVAGTGAIGTEVPTAQVIEAGVNATGNVGSESVSISGWGQLTWGEGTWGDG